jgi:YLP motif-containing protein 1
VKVILFRGVPGSGKSYYAKRMLESLQKNGMRVRYCSADDFRMVSSPENPLVVSYQFDPKKNSQVHSECFQKFLKGLEAKDDYVLVDNTFIQKWEMENYFIAARMMCYDVDVVELRTRTVSELKLCVARNQHGVPAEVICRMAMDFEPSDDHILGLTVINTITTFPESSQVVGNEMLISRNSLRN